PPSGCHHALPPGFSRCHLFELPTVVDLKWSLSRSTVFTVVAVQPFDSLRAAERPPGNLREEIGLGSSGQAGSEVFESEPSPVAGRLLHLDREGIAVLGFELLCSLGRTGLVLGGQGLEETHSPKPFEFPHFPSGVQRKGVIGDQSPE